MVAGQRGDGQWRLPFRQTSRQRVAQVEATQDFHHSQCQLVRGLGRFNTPSWILNRLGRYFCVRNTGEGEECTRLTTSRIISRRIDSAERIKPSEKRSPRA